jgi:hypothetical protein
MISEIADALRRAPDGAAVLAQEILDNGDAYACRFQILALGAAGIEESRSALMDILFSDAASQTKTMAAVACALDPNGRELRCHLLGGSITVNIQGIDDASVLGAVVDEWNTTEDPRAAEIMRQILVASSSNTTAANALWDWITDGRSDAEITGRANKLARSLKGNEDFQPRLINDLLDGGAEADTRRAAALILGDVATATYEEGRETLQAVVADPGANEENRGYAFLGMNAEDRSAVQAGDLIAIMKSKAVPLNIRKDAIRRRSRGPGKGEPAGRISDAFRLSALCNKPPQSLR